MKRYEVRPVGVVRVNDEGMFLELDAPYIPAIQGLEGFGHLQLVWWFSELDGEQCRQVVETPKPYQRAPEVLGIFATRSPVRPNPIGLSVVGVVALDRDKGRIRVDYVDAHDGTPILDIKPYTPSADRVERPAVPAWCAHWPGSLDTSGDFDWEAEFTF